MPSGMLGFERRAWIGEAGLLGEPREEVCGAAADPGRATPVAACPPPKLLGDEEPAAAQCRRVRADGDAADGAGDAVCGRDKLAD